MRVEDYIAKGWWLSMIWLPSIIMAIITNTLFRLFLEDAIFVGWAIGGLVGVVLAGFFAVKMLGKGGFLGGLPALLILIGLIQFSL